MVEFSDEVPVIDESVMLVMIQLFNVNVVPVQICLGPIPPIKSIRSIFDLLGRNATPNPNEESAIHGAKSIGSQFFTCRDSNTDGFFGRQCVQLRRACSVGVSPTGEEVRIPVAWIVSVEETKPMKPIDKALARRVSKSPGRNVSEPTGGLENFSSGGRALCLRAKAAWLVAV